MSVISRRFAASPHRTAASTWEAIVEVITAKSAAAKISLLDITGIVASVIADETPANHAITIIGNGSRLRVYCLYGGDAIGDDRNEASLSWQPFDSEWEIHFPVEEADFEWVTKLLKEKGSMFKTYKPGEQIDVSSESEDKSEAVPKQLTINVNKL